MNKIVNYEIATLIKAKGFNLKVVNFYNHKKLSLISDKDRQVEGLVNYNPINWNFVREHYTSAPTIAEVIMWLYEKYGIWIQVHHWTNQPVDDELWENCFCAYVNGDNMDAAIFKTPTEAYEAALEYVLKEVI